MTALDAELADRGHLLTAPLRQALAALPHDALAEQGKRLLAGVDALLGADRTHLPLFRDFPESVPYGDAHSLYTTRIRAFLAAQPDQPCMVCGAVPGGAGQLRGCGHLVCRHCWAVAGWSCCEECCDWFDCPVCLERYPTGEPTSPWEDRDRDRDRGRVPEPDRDREPDRKPGRGATPGADGVLRLLHLAPSRAAAVHAELAALLARRTPLNPQDHDDLYVLLAGAAEAAEAAGAAGAAGAANTPHAPGDPGTAPGWLPARIPLRESKALALDVLLGGTPDPGTYAEILRARVDTATDVLRLLCVRSGGDPDLLTPPHRITGLPRPLRRVLLQLLDGLPFASLAEDLARHPVLWKRVAERLHPFEYAARHPRAALAFAALRGTDVTTGTPLAELLIAEAGRHPDHIRLTGRRLRLTTWAARVEDALASYDVATAAALLAARPGELLRRLGQLLSRAAATGGPLPDAVTDALAHALPKTAPGPLLGALGALRARALPQGGGGKPAAYATAPLPASRYVYGAYGAYGAYGGDGAYDTGPRRVFFPRGSLTRAFAVPDQRPGLAPDVVASVCALLEGEILDRLAAGVRTGEAPALAPAPAPSPAPAPYDAAVLDTGLADLPVPAAERGAAASLVAIPRGSALPMPGADGRVRLFLHWTQPRGVRVDLDLSVAMYDETWRFLGLCDYTRLEYAGGAAVHSGDLTSAPAPHGATEYVDLDPARLAKAGVRHLVTVVFSYNDVPFEELPDAFAGFMRLDAEDGGAGATGAAEQGARGARRTRRRARRAAAAGPPPQYDPRTVRQRFDLTGDTKISVPMTVDLSARQALWTDVTLGSEGVGHNVWRYRNRLAALGRDMTDAYRTGTRTTLWDLACWHAAARTRAGAPVLVRASAAPGGAEPHASRATDLHTYRRRRDESLPAFAARLREGWAPDGVARGTAPALEPGTRAFCALVQADLPGLPGDVTGTAYRLFPGPSDAAALERVTAGDLVAELAPRTV
ncbi:hypothetical protein DVA86_31665 [Streptomyces armeniacus]|uniref:RING-type domain-containing protein n=1 Tax=Streptomyces armeniacus TaxID=83291 RepID=A0A345Y1P0_9ACTN|nr:hypothetical protein DVA86_31665 [Streptomyces armeniacus]